MADLINEIVAPQAPQQVEQVIKLLMDLMVQMDLVTKSASEVRFKFTGLNDIAQLIELLRRSNGEVGGMVDAEGKLIDVTAQLNNLQKEYNKTVSENAAALAASRLELSYVSEQMKILTKDIQEGKGAIDTNNESLARYALRQQELKVEIGLTTSAIKTEVKEIMAANGSIDEMAQSLYQLKERYRALNSEQRNSAEMGGALRNQIKALDTEIKALNGEMGDHQRNVGNYGNAFERAGAKVVQFATRDIYRAIAGMLVMQFAFTPLAEALQLFIGYIAESIPGTEAYNQKIEKAREGNEALTQSFNDLAKATNEFYLDQRLLNDAFDSITETFGRSVEGLKAASDMVKALGATNGEVYDAEKNQLAALQAVRQKEIEQLGHQADGIRNVQNTLKGVTNDVKGVTGGNGKIYGTGHLSAVETQGAIINDALEKSNIPSDLRDKMKAEVDKAVEKKADMYAFLLDLERKYGIDVEKINQQVESKRAEMSSAEVAFETKQKELRYQKARDLTTQTDALNEQSRQAKEAGDANSVDKIVADTAAKYALMAKSIQRNYDDYLKSNGNQIDENTKAYERLLSTLHAVGEQEKKNKEFEFEAAQYRGNITTGASLASGAAGIAKGQSDNGIPNYGNMANALQLETEAKKQALRVQFESQAAAIQDSAQIIELQKQRDQQLINIDAEAYNKRLALATDYFNKIAAKVNAETAIFTQQADTDLLNTLTGIQNGSGLQISKDAKSEAAINNADRIKARASIFNAKQNIPGAYDAYLQTGNDVRDADTPEKKAKAAEAQTVALAKLVDLQHQQAAGENALANIDKIEAEKKIAMQQEIKNKSIQFAQEAANAIITIKQNEFAKEQQQLDIKANQIRLQAEQEKDAILATQGYQVTKNNQLARLAAQTAAQENTIEKQKQQLEIKKAKFDRDASIAKAIMDTAVAEAGALAYLSNPITAPFYPAVAALIAATGAAQIAAASSAPIPQFRYGTDATKTPVFIAGEAGENELIAPPGKAPYWSGDKAKVFHEPIGTRITPLSKIQQLADSNMIGGGWSIPSHSNKDITDKLDQLLQSDQRSTNDIVWALGMNKKSAPIINVININSHDLQ